MYMVVDETGAFRGDNFQKAIAAMTNTAPDGGAKQAKQAKGGIKARGASVQAAHLPWPGRPTADMPVGWLLHAMVVGSVPWGKP